MIDDSSKSRLLVVTGDETTLSALRWVLQDDYRLEVASPDLAECRRAVERFEPTFVLLDLDLLETDEDFRHLEELVDNPHVGAVAVLARSNQEARLRSALVAGARQYLYKPLDRREVGEVLASLDRHHRLRQSILRKETIPGAGLWAFSSARTGVGQSTLLLSLASELLVLKRDVLVVDLDLHFGDLAFMLDLHQDAPNLSTLLNAEHDGKREVVEQHLRVHASGLQVLVPPSNLETAYGIDMARAVELVRNVSQHYDFVLVDLPAGVPDTSLPILDEARFIFVASNGDPAVFRNVRRLVEILLDLGYAPDKIRPILTAFEEGQVSLREYERVLTHAGLAPAHVFPRDDEGAARAIREGQPVCRVAPKGDFTRSLLDFLLPILKVPLEARPAVQPRSFLRSFLG